MSGLDFLTLILQSSNSFNPNAFFNSFEIYFFLVSKSVVNYCILGPCVYWSCLDEARSVFCFLFVGNLQTVLPLNPYFRDVHHFLYVLFVMMGLRSSACMCKSCSVSDQVWTSQHYIKFEYVRT